MAKCVVMEQDLVSEIQDYCRSVGISPSTLSVRVLGNSRFFDRLNRRAEKLADDAEKIRAYMAENPPKTPEGARQ